MRALSISLMLVALSHTLAFFALSQTNESNSDHPIGISGTYTFGHQFGNSSLMLAEDGSYSWEGRDCTTLYTEQGTYTFTNNTLTLTIRTSARQPHPLPGDNARPISENNTDENGAGTSESRAVRRLAFVRWGERLYLIEESELRAFCNAINGGIEPRRTNSVDDYTGTFYLRVGDEEKPVTGIPELPETWRGCIGQTSQGKNP